MNEEPKNKLIFVVSNNRFSNLNGNGETAAIPFFTVYNSYLKARRAINKYTIWEEIPKIRRKVVPLHVIKKVILENRNIILPMTISLFEGVDKFGNNIIFSISIINPKL